MILWNVKVFNLIIKLGESNMRTSIIDIVKQTEDLLNSSEICGKEAVRVRELSDKLKNQQITVSVIGQFKRGKSTLVNEILGEKLLPVGIVPVTSAVTRIQYGEKSAAVHFENGIIRPVAFEALSEYISEQENPDNELGVSSVTLQTPSEFLKDGLTVVDTPGVGSVHKHNSDAAYAFVKESDAVIFTLSVDSPINEIEIEFLKNAKEYASKFYFVVNKIDVVSEEELSAYLNYCRKLLCRLMDVESINMYAVSAKNGDGIVQLKDSILNDCKAAAKKIIEDSVAMKLKDIISCTLSQLELYWNALKMPIGRFDNRFNKMGKYLSDFQTRKNEVVFQFEEEAERLIEELKKMLSLRGDHIRKAEDGLIKIELIQLYKEGIQKIEDACWEMSNDLEANLNEIKLSLASTVSELFGMEYHYEIKTLNLNRDSRMDHSEKNIDVEFLEKTIDKNIQLSKDDFDRIFEKMILDYTILLKNKVSDLSKRFSNELEQLCSELHTTLNRIMMYRETSTYVVARRIEDLNILTRNLKKIKSIL